MTRLRSALKWAILVFLARDAAVADIVPTDSIPADSAIAVGHLPNGMTYYLRRNGWPEDRVELRLAVRAGSLFEAEDQRGLAHFVEHMAFNGSAHFPPGELVRFFESIGARLGPDLNASTGFDATVYKLEVPAHPESLLERGFLMLADVAARVTFADSEVARERGVVLEEWRGRLGASERMSRIVLPVLYHGSRYAERLPIGDPDVIRGAPPARLRDFYSTWYRPERMAVCVVGDVGTARVDSLVRANFGGIPPSSQHPEPPASDVPPHRDALFAIATDPEARLSSVGITFKQPRQPLRTLGDYRTSIVRSLLAAMLNERFSDLARIPDAPFLGASASFGVLAPGTRSFSLGATVQDGGVDAGLRALVLELRRAAVHRFGAAELDRARSSLLANLEQAYQERDRTESESLVGQCVANFTDRLPIPGIGQRLRLAREILPGISLDDVNAVLDTIVRQGSRVVVVQAPQKQGLATPTEADLRNVIAAAESMAVTPWHDLVAGRSLLESAPVPGHVRARREIPAIGVTVLELSNGVDVWLRPTDFKKDEVIFSAVALGGASVVDPKRYQAATQATAIVREAGYGGFAPTQLSKLLAGKLVAVGPFVGDFTQGASGSSTPQDLETAMQLLHLVFTQVSERPEAVEVVRKRLRTVLANRDKDPGAAFEDAVARTNTHGHYMERPLALETVEALKFQPAVDFYRSCFANAADFTFFVVGAFQVDAIVPLLEEYVGSLPSTGKRRSTFRDRKYRFPNGTEHVDVRKGKEPRSETAISFFADAGRDRMERVRVRAATELVDIRLRDILREQLGSTYSVDVDYDDLQPVPGFGTIRVDFGGAPENRDRMVAATMQEIERLQREGPTEADVRKIQEILRRELEVSEKENGWWLGALQTSHLLGLDPAGIVSWRERVDAISRADLQRVFQRYFPSKRSTRVSLLPEAGAGVPDSAAAVGAGASRR